MKSCFIPSQKLETLTHQLGELNARLMKTWLLKSLPSSFAKGPSHLGGAGPCDFCFTEACWECHLIPRLSFFRREKFDARFGWQKKSSLLWLGFVQKKIWELRHRSQIPQVKWWLVHVPFLGLGELLGDSCTLAVTSFGHISLLGYRSLDMRHFVARAVCCSAGSCALRKFITLIRSHPFLLKVSLCF